MVQALSVSVCAGGIALPRGSQPEKKNDHDVPDCSATRERQPVWRICPLDRRLGE